MTRTGDAAGAYEVCTDARALFPEQTGIWRAYADAARRSGRAGQAAGELTAYLSAHADESGLWISLGECLESDGRLGEATEAYEKGLALAEDKQENARDPVRLATLKEHQGNMLAALGDVEAARRKYREAIEIGPSVYPPYESLSNTYVEADDLEGLREEWERAAAEHPERTQAHFSLGVAYHRLDMLDNAIASYRRALELDPSGPGTQECLFRALMTRAGNLLEAGELEQARAAYRDAIDLWPHAYPPYDALSETYTRSEDHEGLRDEWLHAAETHPERALNHYCLGLAYQRLAMLDEAIAAYKRALELNPAGQGTRDALARALELRAEKHREEGRPEAASQDAQTAEQVKSTD